MKNRSGFFMLNSHRLSPMVREVKNYDEEFTNRTWITEHYEEKGRRIIAKNVADSLKKIL